LTEIEEKIIEQMVSKDLVLECELAGVDFLGLDKKTRSAMIRVFQLGIGYMEKIRKEQKAKEPEFVGF